MSATLDLNNNKLSIDLNVLGLPTGGGSGGSNNYVGTLEAALSAETSLSIAVSDVRLLTIQGLWVKPNNGLSFLRLNLNGALATGAETVELVEWEGGENDPAFTEFALGVHSVASNHQIDAVVMVSKTSSINTLLESRGIVHRPSGSGTLDTFHTVMAGRADALSTSLASVEVATSLSNDIGVGSWFAVSAFPF